MENKLLEKMIKNCFKQYDETNSLPIGARVLEELTHRILQAKEKDPAIALYEVVNDIVYEFLTK